VATAGIAKPPVNMRFSWWNGVASRCACHVRNAERPHYWIPLQLISGPEPQPSRAGVVQRILLILTATAVVGCSSRDLRGRSTPSTDGHTYLIIADDNGGRCGPLLVDGAQWPHALGVAGPVRPGEHTIACGTHVVIRIDSGATFRFDYWGP
jgi:hypothetical protein